MDEIESASRERMWLPDEAVLAKSVKETERNVADGIIKDSEWEICGCVLTQSSWCRVATQNGDVVARIRVRASR